MGIKEKTIKEIEKMDNKSLIPVYDFLRSIGTRKITPVSGTDSSKKVRKLLSTLEGELSDDIIKNRRDRI